jgi:ATP/maltotriose-dependent transcriptional regulator MalT
MASKRFRIAFSFAGEKREFVSRVAAILAERFGEAAILYDKYHEAEFARCNLGVYLPDLYRKKSALVVIVVCPAYSKKQWTGLEWAAIHDLLSKRKDEEVMLCRFGRAEVAGLYSTAGFIELDRKTPKQTATLIVERLESNESKQRRRCAKPATAASNASTPNNLPRLQYFFGREADLKRIADALAPDARGWGALIDGPGGIGKTALAIRAAELVPVGRFSRIIFLSAKERELTADGQRALGTFVLPTCLEMLNAIARELEQPDLTKSPDSERSELILRALREQNVLLVLDNLETLPSPDRDQLFAILNRLPRGTSAIVTSRRRADAGAVSVRLDRLDWEGARALIAELGKDFVRLGQASDTDRRALYDETGGNPLLIRWVAGQLGQGRYRTVAAALVQLRNPEAGNNPLEFVFGDLLDTFTKSETKALAALSYFTQQIEVRHIAELGALTQTAAQTALCDLSTRALVAPDDEEQTFALVPMVADFLRQTRRAVIEATGNRLEKRAYAIIVENGYENHDRFSIIEVAWPFIFAAIPVFLAGKNRRLQLVCDALRAFMEFSGRWDEWASLSTQAEKIAVFANDFASATRRACNVSWVYQQRGQTQQIAECADRAETHSKHLDSRARERAMALRLRGISFHLDRNFPAAIDAYRRLVGYWRKESPKSAVTAGALSDLGAIEDESGDIHAAECHFREALEIYDEACDLEGLAVSNGNLAQLAFNQDDWKTAESFARKAVELDESVGRKDLTAEHCFCLAYSLALLNRQGEALPYARRAAELYAALKSTDQQWAIQLVSVCES